MRSAQEFRTELQRSYFSVAKVAEYFRRFQGLQVQVLPNLELPDGAKDRHMYRDDGDLLLTYPVEVKRSNIHAWTGKHDFPFANVHVMSVRQWDQLRVKPMFIVFVDKNNSSAAVIKGGTKEQWQIIAQRDKDGVRDAYVCPKYLCDFISLSEIFKEDCKEAQPPQNLTNN
jgi:hypothetical protein